MKEEKKRIEEDNLLEDNSRDNKTEKAPVSAQQKKKDREKPKESVIVNVTEDKQEAMEEEIAT